MAKAYDWSYLENPLVEENSFRGTGVNEPKLPAFEVSRRLLPEPIWEGQPATLDCYWHTWQLAFQNLRQPTPENGFVANYIDTAFSNNLFMWDSVFILFFGRYGQRAFNFQRTLDNFYASQHADGFMCKELQQNDGADALERFDPSSTGPNVLAWSEWEHYSLSQDFDRLGRVFPVVLAYHEWLRTYRTWPDGTYWANGIACGMDNQPRLPVEGAAGGQQWRRPRWSRRSVPANWPEDISWLYHGHLGWIDTTLQQVLSARKLLQMAEVLNRADDMPDLQNEIDYLTELVNRTMWDEATAFYYDRQADGKLSDVKSVGAYWALLAGIVPPDRMARFVAHLENEAEFNRPHRVPSLSADHRHYHVQGGYWLGSVWPPTNYMLMRGLAEAGRADLAHELALNHVANVVQVWQQTGTLWENYAPEQAAPGNAAKGDFVGWGGLGPITVLLEHVIGLRSLDDVSGPVISWDIRLLEGHGVRRYPFGPTGLLEVYCADRANDAARPVITATVNQPVTLKVSWHNGQETMTLVLEPD